MEDEIVMYIVVAGDLGMGKGKIAAQVAHSVGKVIEDLEYDSCDLDLEEYPDQISYQRKERINMYREWKEKSYTKIILKAPEEVLKELAHDFNAITKYTIDEGRTQIEKGSLTSVAFEPMKKSIASITLKRLKLL